MSMVGPALVVVESGTINVIGRLNRNAKVDQVINQIRDCVVGFTRIL